ncbi:uncharacterized protein M6B38_109195 [Iris pallida]|uniref:Uncharacterized protein n=1 Tax=Iris pallida TaxID=29817 RepID=A0AAX6EGN2_IRIPA|nr:uncharacterized protein M6B38_109195 [Iris pallida]
MDSGGKSEIEPTTTEESPLLQNPNPRSSVKTKVPEVEIHLYRAGKGPAEVLRSALGGWDQDRLEVQDLLDRHGLKSLHAFSPGSGRGAPIRFNARNGRSLLPYKDGSVIYVDGEPKDSLVQPITKIIVGIAMLSLLVAILVREVPDRFNISKLTGDKFPPWVIACVVILFTRLRKRTKSLLKKFGW